MKKDRLRRILAILGIVILLSMYAINLILALIGSEAAQQMLKITMVGSIMIPILLYAMLVLMKKTSGFSANHEEELTEEQKQEIYRLMEEQEKK